MDQFFKEFEKYIDSDFINSIKEIEKLNKELSFDRVPDGVYKVELNDLILKLSKKGNLMIQATFQIMEGQYEKNQVWAYFVINNRTIQNVNHFLMSLGTGDKVFYENKNQYEELVKTIFMGCKYWKEYELKIITTNTGFRNYEILSFKEKEPEELPFS